MTRIRIIRDIVVPVADGTHTIQRGTYFYVYGNRAIVINGGACIDIPNAHALDRTRAHLFVGEDFEIVADPIPF